MSKHTKKFLVFNEDELSPEQKARYSANIEGLRNREVVAGTYFDWDILDSCGLTARITPFLRRTAINSRGVRVEDDSWWNLFHIEEDSYLELMKEFIASFSYRTEAQNNEEIRFRMCGRWYSMSPMSFGVALGLYPAGSINDYDFGLHFNGTCVKSSSGYPDYNNQRFWAEVSDHPYDPSNSIAHMLRDPIARLLHRFLTMTIFHAEGAVKLPMSQWFTLFCLMNTDRWLNLPHIIAMEFSKRAQWWDGRNPKNALISGPLITRLARNLNAIASPRHSNRTNLRHMVCVKTKIQGEVLLLRLPVIAKEGDGYRILGMGEGQKEIAQFGPVPMEEEAPQEPPRRSMRQRRRTRDEQAPEDEQDHRGEAGSSTYSLQQSIDGMRELMIYQNEQAISRHNHVVGQINQLGYYNDDIVDRVTLADQRAQYRYQHGPTELPQPEFMGEFPSTQRWTDRRDNQGGGSSGHGGWRPW